MSSCLDVFLEGVEQLFWRLDVVGVARRFDYYLPCAIVVVSKVLGYCVVAGSLGYKLPQISTVWKSRSAQGLSPAAFELDVLVFTASLGYSIRSRLPLSEYGEQGVVLIQNLVLVVLVWIFKETDSKRRIACVIGEAAAVTAIVLMPESLLFLLPNVALLAAFGSRLPQIYANQRQRHTGQLATSTSILNVAGSLARILTTLGGSKNPFMLLSYSSSCVLNSIVLGQILAFRHNTQIALQKKGS